jgi:ABC-type multidrug transport system fused ATPase/permease subunit
LIGILVFMLYFNLKLATVALAVVPFFLWFIHMVRRRFKEAARKLSEASNQYREYVTELVAGLKTVQMFNRERSELEKERELVHEKQKIRRENQKRRVFGLNLIWSFTDSLGEGILFAVGAWLIWNHELSIGELLAFTSYVSQLYSSVNSIQYLYNQTIEVKPEMERLEEMLNLPEENVDVAEALPLKWVSGEIEFVGVSFRYTEEREVLKNVTFNIRPGEMVGIVGPTGGGKSTILDLLMRFYRPNGGEIRLDGRNIEEYCFRDYREKFGLVSQDIFLWNRSIRQNLLYVAPDAPEEELWHVLRVARLDGFVAGLPDGLDTVVGDRGVRLSGGERQRLAIARALLKNPDILLLDEPTAALDACTEAVLQRYLEQVYRGKTVIVVAHRLATVRGADRILVVSNGEIEETGTHEELMEKRGVYWQLYTEQMGMAERGAASETA